MSILDGKKFLILDTETTSKNAGHPFDPANKLLFVGLYDGDNIRIFDIEFTEKPYGKSIQEIQDFLDGYDVIVAFNAKFDLHWLRRYGIDFSNHFVWDLQYAEFCFAGQQWSMPSCDDACSRRSLQGKLPFDHSIEHSRSAWVQYLHRDLICEYDLFQAQRTDLGGERAGLLNLIWYGSQDLKITEEMEWNGLKYDVEKSLTIGDEILQKIAVLDSVLSDYSPHPSFSWASPTHLSALLYGGIFKYETVETVYKTLKGGRVKERLHKVIKEIILPRLVEPFKTSGVKRNEKETDQSRHYYSTDEGTLKTLKASGSAKEIIKLLLTRRTLAKSVGTYYHGIPKKIEEMGWQNELIHAQLNHCVAATGRLSSAKPNIQNLESSMRQCIVSRFPLHTQKTIG